MNRKDFTILRAQDVAYLDQAASSLTPDQVLADMQKYYCEYRSNVHRGVYAWSEKASFAYENAREVVAGFIGAKPHELIFTQGTTGGINLVTQIYLKNRIKAGQVVLLTPLEHHSNMVPWQRIAKECGAYIEYIKLDSDFCIDWEDLEKRLDNVALIAITHSSNVLGVKYDIQRISKYGIDVLVDGAQMVAHEPVDVKDLGCAFYAFSAHKMYGPTGIGALYIDEKYHDFLSPHFTGGGMVEEVTLKGASLQKGPIQFEPGTPNIASAIGFASAVKYIQNIGFNSIQLHENELMAYMMNRLKPLGLKTFGPLDTTVYSFEYPDIHPHDVATILGENNVMVRAGHHCCMPLMTYLGVNALTRVSIGVYSQKTDIDNLVNALLQVKEVML